MSDQISVPLSELTGSVPDYKSLATAEATQAQVRPALVHAIMDAESFDPKTGTNNPQALSPKGARGLMQLMPDTAKQYGVDPADPVQNIKGGVAHLKYLLGKYQNDETKAVAAYNAGEGTVDRANGVPNYPETQRYVQKVLAQANQGQIQVPLDQLTQSATPAAGAPPVPRSLTQRATDFGADVLKGLDPRTPTGRSNLAGGAGAAAALAVTRNPWVAARIGSLGLSGMPAVAGAYAGGAAENIGEQVAGTVKDPAPFSLGDMTQRAHAAGSDQAINEMVGQVVSWPFKAAGRAIAASKIGKSISTHLAEALEATKSRLTQGQGVPKISPSQAGTLVHDVAFDGGPAATVKDLKGEAVGAAAKAGPALPTAPLKERLAQLADQITPMASHEGSVPATMVSGKSMSSAQLTEMATKHPELGLSIIPPDHPLPGVLAHVRAALEDIDAISFEDGHKIKRLLDDAVSWDSPAKKQVQQITKGFRQTLREQMSAHAPYNQATEEYAKVAQLYTRPIQTLHREILTNPEGLVAKVDWKHPSQARLLKELTVEVPKEAGDAGAQQGEAAWNGLRAAYTRDKLIAKGPAAMNAEIAKMKATGNGQEFLQTMYGDPQGSTVLKNLEQLGGAWQQAATNVETFNQTGLAHAQGPAQAVGDVLSVTMHGHPIMGLRAGARLVMGPHAKEMIEWASRSPSRTQFVIKHVLTGPEPGIAVADFYRWMQSSEESGNEPDQPQPSHEVSPPPAPRMTRTSAPPQPR